MFCNDGLTRKGRDIQYEYHQLRTIMNGTSPIVFRLLALSFVCCGWVSAFSTPTRDTNRMEAVVHQYFEGVNQKDPQLIRDCFDDITILWDVCSLRASFQRKVNSDDMVERCMDFVKAHPDCLVQFHYGPECGQRSDWVVAHWYETGTWSGDSCGISATNRPMVVEGQTRFLVDTESYKIKELVVTRTFTEWEEALMKKQIQEQEA